MDNHRCGYGEYHRLEGMGKCGEKTVKVFREPLNRYHLNYYFVDIMEIDNTTAILDVMILILPTSQPMDIK